jgi:hypothetical protein
MAGLFRTEREAVPVVALLGVDPLTITPGLSALDLWFELLGKLAAQGNVRALVKTTRDQFRNNPRAAYLDSLLGAQDAPVSPADQKPGFDDAVTAPEALLFHDDLTMPLGKIGGLIATLTKMVELAPAICLLQVDNVLGSFFGTGFRIGGDTLLTNHHVLFPHGQKATHVKADFGFDVDAAGGNLAAVSLTGNVGTVTGEQPDDWAVVDVQGMDQGWPVLKLADADVPIVGSAAYILQHPNGQRRRLGFVRNLISDVDAGTVKYITDTQPGSSGSPVLSAGGRLLALHHAGGQPVEVVGMPPVSKNEGIRISRVLDRLKANGLA